MPSRCTRAPALGAALLLAACGGGGGGGGGTQANPPVTPPALFTLSDANAADAASFALGGVEEAFISGESLISVIAALLSSGQTQLFYNCVGSPPNGTQAGTARYIDNDGGGSFTAGDRVVIDIPQCAGTSTEVDATVTELSGAGFSASATFDVTRSSSATHAQGSATYSFAAALPSTIYSFAAA
jgi:hypothetical protein